MELVEQRKEEVSAVLLVENHVLEVAEVRAQVREKRRAVESAPRAGGALQWRLSGLEAALQALEPRQAALLEEAALLAVRFPAQAARLHQGAEELGAEWGALAGAAQACGEAVAAAGRLQRFLHDLDAFLDWLVRAQEAAGGGEGPLPRSLAAPRPPCLALLVWPSFWVWPASRHWAHPRCPPKPGQNFPKPRCHIRFPEGEAKEREETRKPPRIGLRGRLGLPPTGEEEGRELAGGDRLGLLMTRSSCYKRFSGR